MIHTLRLVLLILHMEQGLSFADWGALEKLLMSEPALLHVKRVVRLLVDILGHFLAQVEAT